MRGSKRQRHDEGDALWLVDGYNVLRVTLHAETVSNGDAEPEAEVRWWSASQRQLLAELSAPLAALGGEICLVFDGAHLREPQEGEAALPGSYPVRLLFVPSADEWIVRRVRDHADERVLRIVTADRRLADRARARGAEIVSTGDFVRLCRAAAGASARGVD